MSLVQNIARMSAGPLCACASSLLISSGGRQTSSKATSTVTKTSARKMTTAINRLQLKLQPKLCANIHLYFKSNNVNANQKIRYLSNAAKNAGPKTEARASSTATAQPPKNMNFIQWYEHHLQNRPIATKAVTGSLLWGLGDIVAQVVPIMFQTKDADDTEKSLTNPAEHFDYDYTRTARAMVFGFGIHAPLSHAHFNFLEWMTVKGGFTGLGIPVFKTVMEQFVYWSWISNSLYHGTMGAMQGKTPTEVYDRIADVLWDTQKAQWVFWIPVQLLNFKFVPVRHQLNVVLITSVVWTALLSAWYPPEENNKDQEGKEGKDLMLKQGETKDR